MAAAFAKELLSVGIPYLINLLLICLFVLFPKHFKFLFSDLTKYTERYFCSPEKNTMCFSCYILTGHTRK